MRKMICVALTMLSLAAASHVWAGPPPPCRELPDEAVRTYARLRATREAEFVTVKRNAEAVKAFFPDFKKAIDEFNAAHRAWTTKYGQRPRGNSSLQEQAAMSTWNSELSGLEATRATKMDAVNAAFVRLGRDDEWYALNSSFLSDTIERIGEILGVLDNAGAEIAGYTDAINTLITPPDSLNQFGINHLERPPTKPSGLIGTYFGSDDKYQEARDAEFAHTQSCQAGYQLYNDNVLAGRKGDGSAIVAGANNPQAAATTNPTSTSVNNAGILTGETANSTTTANTTATAATANTSTTATNNTTPTSNTTATAVANYIVKAGDNLTAIARSLAAQLGNKPVPEIVNALYRNITSRSRENPNLIFPGDTINLAGVRRDLRVG